MIRSLLVPALSAAAMLPAAAWAEPVFDAFKDVCLTPGGGRIGAVAAAEAKGWRPMREGELAAFRSFVTKDDPTAVIDGRIDGELSSPAKLRWGLVAGHTNNFDGSGFAADFCLVAAASADLEGVKAELGRYAAVPQVMGVFADTNASAFAWRDGPGGRKPVSAEEIEKGSPAGAKILVAFGQGAVVLVGLLAPTK